MSQLGIISERLRASGIDHVVVSASPATNEHYWISSIAKKLSGYLNNLKYAETLPTKNYGTLVLGGKTYAGYTFKLYRTIGNKRTVEATLEHLGLGSRDKPKSGNAQLYATLDSLLRRTNVFLADLPKQGSLELPGIQDASARPASGAFIPHKPISILLIPCTDSVTKKIVRQPSSNVLEHELLHAWDYASTGYAGRARITDQSDYDNSGAAYYLDLPEVKARTQELVSNFNAKMKSSLAVIADYRDMLNSPGRSTTSKASLVKMLGQRSRAIHNMLESYQVFLDTLLDYQTPDNMFGAYFMQGVETFAKHISIALIKSDAERTLVEDVAIDYLNKHMRQVYQDVKSRYSKLIPAYKLTTSK